MRSAANPKLRLRQENVYERLVYCLLLPLLLLVLGTQRLLSGTNHDGAVPSRQSLWTEARSQASIATFYVFWA
jgi:hypothetical protein